MSVPGREPRANTTAIRNDGTWAEVHYDADLKRTSVLVYDEEIIDAVFKAVELKRARATAMKQPATVVNITITNPEAPHRTTT